MFVRISGLDCFHDSIFEIENETCLNYKKMSIKNELYKQKKTMNKWLIRSVLIRLLLKNDVTLSAKNE